MPGQQAHLADYCAGAMFVQQLLSRGYGFDERAFGGVIFQKKVGWGRSGAGQPLGGRGLSGAEATPFAAGRRHCSGLGARLHAEPD